MDCFAGLREGIFFFLFLTSMSFKQYLMTCCRLWLIAVEKAKNTAKVAARPRFKLSRDTPSGPPYSLPGANSTQGYIYPKTVPANTRPEMPCCLNCCKCMLAECMKTENCRNCYTENEELSSTTRVNHFSLFTFLPRGPANV